MKRSESNKYSAKPCTSASQYIIQSVCLWVGLIQNSDDDALKTRSLALDTFHLMTWPIGTLLESERIGQ